MIVEMTKTSPREAYHYLASAIVPRPIAWVTTRSSEGIVNAAPFSFFNIVSTDPPIVMIAVGRSAGRQKDTARNIREAGEFGIAIVNEDHAADMNATSASHPPDVSEATVAGVALQPGRLINVPLIATSQVKLECRLERWLELGNGPTDVIFGQVLLMDIDEQILREGRISGEMLKAVGRMGGNQYCRTTDLFEMTRPR